VLDFTIGSRQPISWIILRSTIGETYPAGYLLALGCAIASMGNYVIHGVGCTCFKKDTDVYGNVIR